MRMVKPRRKIKAPLQPLNKLLLQEPVVNPFIHLPCLPPCRDAWIHTIIAQRPGHDEPPSLPKCLLYLDRGVAVGQSENVQAVLHLRRIKVRPFIYPKPEGPTAKSGVNILLWVVVIFVLNLKICQILS